MDKSTEEFTTQTGKKTVTKKRQTSRNSNVKTRQKSKDLLRANKYKSRKLVNILNAYELEQPNTQTKELKEHGAMHKVPKVTSTQ